MRTIALSFLVCLSILCFGLTGCSGEDYLDISDLVDGDDSGPTDGDLEIEPAEDGDTDTELEDGDSDVAEIEEEAEPVDTFLPPEEPGPYHPAAFLETFTDEARDRTCPGTVWYPTNETEGPEALYQGWIPFGDAITEVPIAEGGPFPLIVFSHGHQAFDAQSFFLTEYLATHGYIVAAVDHIEDTTFSFDPDKMIKSAVDRPQDIKMLIDTLLEWNATPGHLLEGKIDETRIGASGHSYGGNTAVAVMGARYDINRIFGICNDLGQSGWHGEWWICKSIMDADHSPVDACADPCVFGDDRIKVSVPMTPGLPDAFSPEGLAEVQKPMLIMGGVIDSTVPMTQVQKFFDWSSYPETMLWKLDGAGHMAFSNMCMIVNDPSLGCGPAYIDVDRGWLLINTATVAFFGIHLKGEERYRAYFEEPYLSTDAPEVSIEYKSE